MTSNDSEVVSELRMLREQQWAMHRALIERIDKLDAGLSDRIDQTNARLDETNARLDETNARLEERSARFEVFAERTATAFMALVDRGNRLQMAFDTFLELVLEEHRTLRPEIDQIKARLEALERKAG